MRDTIIAMAHYTGYFGSLALLWLFMVLHSLHLEEPVGLLLLSLLVITSITFGLLGLLYVIGLGGVRIGGQGG